MKKSETFLYDYAAKLSDENLRFLYSRLSQRFSGDLPEALDFIGQNHEMDHWLSSGRACFDIYDMLDDVQGTVTQECQKRFKD